MATGSGRMSALPVSRRSSETPSQGTIPFLERHRHKVSLVHRREPPLRGFLKFGPPEFGERGTGVTLGLRDPYTRHLSCTEAVVGLPIYPGAAVRECDIIHTPGHVNFSLLLATSDASSFVWQITEAAGQCRLAHQ